MKIITNAKITKGYEHWKQMFEENENLRQEYGLNVLAYGHPKDNDNEIYTVISVISNELENIVFILWGSFAQSKKEIIDSNKHLILSAPHPSPLSAHRGFFGSKPFSKTNTFLKSKQIDMVEW